MPTPKSNRYIGEAELPSRMEKNGLTYYKICVYSTKGENSYGGHLRIGENNHGRISYLKRIDVGPLPTIFEVVTKLLLIYYSRNER